MKFICDAMLGKLARYLRALGFDTLYAANEAALRRYKEEDPERLLLTRRAKTAGFRGVVRITSQAARDQLKEIKDLVAPALKPGQPLSRCIECNAGLGVVEKGEIESLVPEFVFHTYAGFKRCPVCGRVYWEGSHAKEMEKTMKEIFG